MAWCRKLTHLARETIACAGKASLKMASRLVDHGSMCEPVCLELVAMARQQDMCAGSLRDVWVVAPELQRAHRPRASMVAEVGHLRGLLSARPLAVRLDLVWLAYEVDRTVTELELRYRDGAIKVSTKAPAIRSCRSCE